MNARRAHGLSNKARQALVIFGFLSFSQGYAFGVHEWDPLNTLTDVTPPQIGNGVSGWGEFCDAIPNWRRLSRKDALYVALCRNAKIQGSIEALKVFSARHGQSIAANLPSITVNSVQSSRDTASFFIDNRPELKVQGDAERTNKSGVSVSLPIFSSGAMVAAMQSTSHSVRAAALDVQEQADSLIVDTLAAYYEFYLAKALIEVYQHGLSIALQAADVSQRREGGGVGSRSEVLQAESALARAEIDLRRARDEMQSKRIALAALLSIDPEYLLETQIDAAEISDDFSVPRHFMNVQDLIQSRPAYASASARFEAAGYRTVQIKREGLPSISLTAGVADQSIENRKITTQSGTEKTFGITLSVPLFEGFGRTYKVREASAQTEVARQEMNAIHVRVESEINQNRTSLLQELEQQQYTQRYVEVSRASHKAALQRYRKGLAELIEVLNAQRELINAESERLRSSVKLIVARMKVQRDQGELSEVLSTSKMTKRAR